MKKTKQNKKPQRAVAGSHKTAHSGAFEPQLSRANWRENIFCLQDSLAPKKKV